MMKPAFEIRMVKENLDLSMALLQAVQEEKVTAKQLFGTVPKICSLPSRWTMTDRTRRN